MPVRIGIPGGLFYYKFYPLWNTFYEELGAEVITSGDTNKNIFDLGVELCVDEACLPVKVYHGHVKSLSGRADMVFIPRIMSICRNEYICPKFCGLPEMVKNSVPGIPTMIDTIINQRKNPGSIVNSMLDAGSVITKNKKALIKAYKKALSVQDCFQERLRETGNFCLSMKDTKLESGANSCKYIALIGHPYIIYDSFINMNIVKKLNAQGFHVITPEMIDDERVNRFAMSFPKRHFWTLGRNLLGAGLSFIEQRDVNGIIYMSSFGCGIDSLIEDYLERQIRRDGKIPYMKLVFDEHTGEAGLNTRLEAFIDMVNWRKDNESNFSSYGRSIRSRQGIS